MTNPHIQRAQLLYQQHRYDLAADALREALALSPNDAHAHALLGLCLLQQKKYDEATAEAAAAIHEDPGYQFAHYASGVIFQHRNRFPEAEAAARESLRLVPSDTYSWALLAETMISRQRWREALDAAEQGLQHDPEDPSCINLRAMALVNLGDKENAFTAVRTTLARNPHDAFSHANQGWTLLHQSKPKEALEHFREALRLNPNMEWAREGMIAALKARYFLYRIMLRYYLWMSKFNRKGRWGIIIGIWIAGQLLRIAHETNPALAPVIYPLLGLYLAFILASWLADPVFNLTLLFNRFGRHLLTPVAKTFALIVGTLLVAGIALVAFGWFADLLLPFLAGLLALLLTLPTAATSRCRPGWHLISMCIYTTAVALVGAASIILITLHLPNGENAFFAAAVGSALASIAANVLLNMIPKK